LQRFARQRLSDCWRRKPRKSCSAGTSSIKSFSCLQILSVDQIRVPQGPRYVSHSIPSNSCNKYHKNKFIVY
jgi:hypothetical protein